MMMLIEAAVSRLTASGMMLELSSIGLVLLPGFGHAKGPLRFSGP
jgi:hypothetical protein